MSLESGKKLCYIASIINIILPVVIAVAVLSFYISLIGSIIASRAMAPSLFGGLYSGIIALCVVSGVLGITALILFLVGMNRLSRYYNEPSIVNNPLRALIIQIIAGAVFLVIYFLIIIYALGSAIAGAFSSTNGPANLLSLFGIYAIILVVYIVIGVYCGLLYKRGFDGLAEKSGVDTIRTAGLLYLIGTIIPVIGWIAWIFAALGYRKLSLKQATTFPTYYTPAPSTEAKKRCVNCGTENPPDAFYCSHCGRQL